MASSASDSAASIPSKDLKNALSPMASQWRELGVQFGFRESDLDGIQQSHPAGGVNQWLRSMLEAKIDSCPGFSWNDVLAALETLGQCTLAEHIRRTFCISHSPTAPAAGMSSPSFSSLSLSFTLHPRPPSLHLPHPSLSHTPSVYALHSMHNIVLNTHRNEVEVHKRQYIVGLKYQRDIYYHIPGLHIGSSSALSELMEENDVRLRDEFADLLVQACKQFEALVTPEAFRTYTRTVFVPAPFISTAVSIREMVGALTDHGRWNYLHYRSLLRLVRRFDRNRELEERCRKYEKSVAHFKFTTRIKDWIVKRNITNDSSQQSKLLPVEYSRLSAKVKINVTDERLGYVMKLWNSIAEHLFELPDLDAVLHNMKEECLLVTWLIPNSNELRDRIRENAPHCSSFFDQHRILYCLLDNECLYKSHVSSLICVRIVSLSISFCIYACMYII